MRILHRVVVGNGLGSVPAAANIWLEDYSLPMTKYQSMMPMLLRRWFTNQTFWDRNPGRWGEPVRPWGKVEWQWILERRPKRLAKK
jgi:hypothetical protein